MIYLILEFMKAGAFAVGGGLATIPFLQKMTENYDWFTSSELLDMIAISESTPGAIGINMATFSGIKAYGILGAILATISLIIPPIIIILIIAKKLNKFKNSKTIKDMFYMLRPSTAGLILASMLSVMNYSIFNVSLYHKTKNIIDLFLPLNAFIFMLILFLSYRYQKLHPIFLILLGAFFGIIFKL